MKKIILLLSVAALALGGCSSVPQTTEQVAIDKVLKVDSSLPANCSSIAQLSTAAETLNLDACPKKFQDAYKKNVDAWKDFAAIEKQMYAVDLEKAKSDIKSFLGTYQSNPTQAIIDLKAKWPQFEKQLDEVFSKIRTSFTNYTNISSNHGIAYPKTSGMFNWF